MTAIWEAAPCSLVEFDRRFTKSTQYPRRQWEPEISLHGISPAQMLAANIILLRNLCDKDHSWLRLKRIKPDRRKMQNALMELLRKKRI
jgi:hypothetical protein